MLADAVREEHERALEEASEDFDREMLAIVRLNYPGINLRGMTAEELGELYADFIHCVEIGFAPGIGALKL